MRAKRLQQQQNLPFYPAPTYLGVYLDRLLTARHHLSGIAQKIMIGVLLVMRLVSSEWCANAKTLCTAALSLVYSTVEYCASVWCRSTHICFIDSVLNNVLRIVSGCQHPTPMDHIPILSGIQPAGLHRPEETLSLAYRGPLNFDHILYGLFSASSDAHQERLNFKHSLVPAARNLLNNLADLSIRASQ